MKIKWLPSACQSAVVGAALTLFVANIRAQAQQAQQVARSPLVIADFEGATYGAWKAEGTAFGLAPAKGTLPSQMEVAGFVGAGLANSYLGGDEAQGTLTSPAFTISRPFIGFFIGGGHRPGEACINLLVNNKIVRTATGKGRTEQGKETLSAAYWDVRALRGKSARIQIRDAAQGGWGHINIDHIAQGDRPAGELVSEKEVQDILNIDSTTLYGETYRPQFHFSAAKNWLNDPNGLVFYAGEYHLFFQHNPVGMQGAGINMHWGHAVSPDLVHWRELPIALSPIGENQRWSGSAVVDWKNSGGFQTGAEPALIAFQTLTGVGQVLSYSNDRGRTWKDYAQNPVLKDGDRDPKVFWHEPTKKWIMALYQGTSFVFYNSPDMKAWQKLSAIEGFYECPDIFELPVDGDAKKTMWVLVDGDGSYRLGDFDGTKFTPVTAKLRGDWGRNFYATQTWNDIPAQDGRRLQIAWMRGASYPQMPWSQQMSFPSELSLRTFPEGIRLCKVPAREIEKLHLKSQKWENLSLKPGDNPLAGQQGDLLHIVADIELGDAQEVAFELRGQGIWFSNRDKKLHAGGEAAEFYPLHNRLKLELLLDRTSLEVFADGGRVSASSCFIEPPGNQNLAVFSKGGTAKIVSLQVHTLRSAWPDAGAKNAKR